MRIICFSIVVSIVVSNHFRIIFDSSSLVTAKKKRSCQNISNRSTHARRLVIPSHFAAKSGQTGFKFCVRFHRDNNKNIIIHDCKDSLLRYLISG